ncbi:hypothetical protein GMMP13_1010009 [Candidatus Magnetomoraceae bacterium gMMP-13]
MDKTRCADRIKYGLSFKMMFILVLAMVMGIGIFPGLTGNIYADVTAVNISSETTAIDESTSSTGLAVTITGDDTDVAIYKSSSNTSLIATDDIAVGEYTGGARSLTITAGDYGSEPNPVTITISAYKGQFHQDTILVTVNDVNEAPTISNITDKITNKNSPTSAISFTIGDEETVATALTVTGTSQNTTLVPNNNISFGGSGANRTVTITPADDQTGTAVIHITVNDGDLTAADTFTLTVNDPPTVTAPSDQVTNKNETIYNLAVTVNDSDVDDDPGDLVLTAESQDTTLVPNINIILGGSGSTRTVTVVPAADQTGSTTITLTISDGDAETTDTFEVTVNSAPTISDIGPQSTDEDTTISNISFTVSDSDGDALTVTGSSSNTDLVTDENIVISGTGSSRTVAITPAPNEYGTATITIEVTDGNETVSDTFVLTVNSENDIPTITDIDNQETTDMLASGPHAFTVTDMENDDGALQLLGSAENTDLVPNGSITFGGSGSNRTVTIDPADGQSGITTITIRVTDLDGGYVEDTFVLTVESVPTISDVANQETLEDTNTGDIFFSVSDADSDNAALTVTMTSSVTSLVGDQVSETDYTITKLGGGNRKIDIAPKTNQTGNTTITLIVEDSNGYTATDTFLLTVTGDNDIPTITDITDKSTNEDTTISGISFTVDDADEETTAESLIITPTSSNQTLVQNENIEVIALGGGSKILSITPTADQNGTATIRVTVSDYTDSTFDEFVLTVNAVNDTPTITVAAPKSFSTTEGTPSDAIDFSIGDVDTDTGSLVVTKSSSDQSKVQDSGISLSGTGTDRTVTITPKADASGGPITITLSVSDGTSSDSDSFDFTIDAVNDDPTISDIPDQNTNQDTSLTGVEFTVGDVDDDTLTVTATSSDPGLLTDTNITFTGNGTTATSRAMSLTPESGQTGTATVTVTVSDGNDGTAQDTFVLTVNGPPSIGDIGNQTIIAGTSTEALSFTISDDITGAGALTVSGSSSITTLVSNTTGFSFGGSDANRTVTITPESSLTGTTTITLMVTDADGLTITDTFELSVNADNITPTISTISDQTTNANTATNPISFTVADNETNNASLDVSRGSSNPTLVPNDNIVIGPTTPTDGNRTVTITPATGQYGITTISLTVSDGNGKSASTSFDLTVTQNTPPTITDIANQCADYTDTIGPLNFTIGDIETAANSLDLTWTSDNTSVVANSNIDIGRSSSGSACQVTITTTTGGAEGIAGINLTVNDADGLTAATSFNVTVDETDPTIGGFYYNSTTYGQWLPVTYTSETLMIKPDTYQAQYGPYTFIVNDGSLPAGNLTVAGVSSNQSIVTTNSIYFEKYNGSDSIRSLYFTTTGNGGDVIITATVTDTCNHSDLNSISLTVFSSGTTLVTLTSFTATPTEDGKIRLNWETASETDTAGFYIWRRTDDGGYEKITENRIESKGVGGFGDSYEFIDENVDPGKEYYYMLEEIDAEGKSSTFYEDDDRSFGSPGENPLFDVNQDGDVNLGDVIFLLQFFAKILNE